MINFIDIHTHLYTRGDTPSVQELERAILLANHYGIDRIVLLGNVTTAGPNPDVDAIRSLNTQSLKVMDLYPDRYIGFCYLNPSHPHTFIQEEIERCVVEGGMKGLKLWIAVKSTDDRLDPILEQAEELDVPLLHHSWYKQTSYSFNESTPEDIAHLARRFPNVTMIMAHLSGCGVRGILDVVDFPNVYVDTSGSQPESILVEYAVEKLGARRVLYGSDWPLRDFGTQIGRVTGAALDPRDRQLILRENAARILKL